ncbi:MAG: autotransporter outer membrane beta-barrel domain-containing protein [Rhizobiales bacterium]|nr:autotransporter outer membrane beta-barrel domain-containing protein [Hyphomicrobiales bacterium]
MTTDITKSVASVSGQVIASQVGDVIGDVFGNPVTVGGNDAFAAVGQSDNVYKARPRKSLIEREWSAWLDARGTGWQNHDPNVGLNGNQANVTGGLARKLTPDVLVGVFTGYEHLKYSIAALAGSMKGNGGSVGGFLGWRVASNARFDVVLGYTRMSYSAASSAATGSFDGNRWIASTGLTGSYGVGSFIVEPSANVYALWERQTAWTDSLGTAQPDRNFTAGRVSTGAKLIRPWSSGDIKIAPYAGLYGDWRFSSDNALAGGQPIVGIGDGWSGRVTSGIAFTGKGGMTVAIGCEYGGIGASYKIWTGNARATWQF